MAWTSTRSPPTSWVMEARSEIVVTTFSGAAKAPVANSSEAMSAKRFMVLLERVRAVRADGELQLEEDFVERAIDETVVRAAELAADLAELGRPEGEGGGDSTVRGVVHDPWSTDVGEERLRVGGVEAHAGEPALGQLVVEGAVEAERVARPLAVPPIRFGTRDEGAIEALHQRLPAVRDVDAAHVAPHERGDVRVRRQERRLSRHPARAHFDVAVLRDVVEGLEMAEVGEVARPVAAEDGFVSVHHLDGAFDERVEAVREDLAHGDAAAVEPFLAEEIVDDERLVDPRRLVGMPRVDLAEVRLELADLGRDVVRQVDEVRVALFHFEAVRRAGEEELRLGIRIDEGLERDFRLVQRQRVARIALRPGEARPEGDRGAVLEPVVPAEVAEEVADDGGVGIEDFGRAGVDRIVDGLHVRQRARRRLCRRRLGRGRGGSGGRSGGHHLHGGEVLRRRGGRSPLQRVQLLAQRRSLRPEVIELLPEPLGLASGRGLREGWRSNTQHDEEKQEMTATGHDRLRFDGYGERKGVAKPKGGRGRGGWAVRRERERGLP